MDRAKNVFRDMRNPTTPTFKITIIILIIITTSYFYFKAQRTYSLENPSFVRRSHEGKTSKIIKSSKFSKSNSGDEVTFHFWMYVDNLVYNYGKLKNVFTKGEKGINSEEQCPGVYIAPKSNDLNIIITTTTKNDYFKMEDFPIRKWFSIGIVMKGTQVDFYKNGLLEFSKNLSGIVKPNTGNMYICNNGGFDGLVSCIHYFPYAKGPKLMQHKHSRGAVCLMWWEKIWDKISGKLSAIKNSLSISVELEVDVDEPTYKEKNNYMCQGDTISDLGKINLDEAKKKCNLDSKCDCITVMSKGMGDLPKGNVRLVNNYNTGERSVKQKSFKSYELERSALGGLLNSFGNNLSELVSDDDEDSE